MKHRLTVLLCATMAVTAFGCEPEAGDNAAKPRIDRRLNTHWVESSTPTPQGLAYLEAIADVHARADAVGPAERDRILRSGLALPIPAELGEAEVLRLELATRLAEELRGRPEGLPVARELLSQMLDPKISLPVDRATARALVTLGDVAAQSGDDALAAGSYDRAIKVMAMLRQELEAEVLP